MPSTQSTSAASVSMVKILAQVCGIVLIAYAVGRQLVHSLGADFSSSMPIWFFRLAVVGAVVGSVILYKRHNQGFISYGRAFAMGMLAALCIGGAIALHTYAYREFLHPTYNAENKEMVRANLRYKYIQVPQERLANPPADTLANPVRQPWSEADLDKVLNEHWGYYFTTQGGMLIDFASALLWGLLTAGTVGFMARRVREEA